MKKIKLIKNYKSLFTLEMISKDEDVMGNLHIYLNKIDNKAWLDLQIKEKWRCRWLSKSFAKFLLQMLIVISKEHGIDNIFSAPNHPNSPRLLDFFGFTKYNDEYYFLNIK